MKAAVIWLLSLSRVAQLTVQVQRSNVDFPAPVVAHLQVSRPSYPRELAPEELLFAAVEVGLSALLEAWEDSRLDSLQELVLH